MPLRRALLLLPLLAAAAWLAWRWAALPERLATSFDLAGNPRDAASRGAFAALALGSLAAMTALFGGLATWIPHAPVRWVNLPEKEYWLAPERRAATCARLAAFLDFLGLGVATFLASLFVGIGETAIAGAPRLSPAWICAPIVLVIASAAGIVWLDAPFRSRRRELRARAR